MSKISIANLKKTIYYLKRNGLRDTYLAALERFREKGSGVCATYKELTEEEKQRQRLTAWQRRPLFSILVPTYKTPSVYLRAMIDSVLDQTYENLELILADASGDDSVKGVVDTYEDERIVYIALEQNGGISENTNAALERARGEYVGLLDHDDLLTSDALYEMARQIETAHQEGSAPVFCTQMRTSVTRPGPSFMRVTVRWISTWTCYCPIITSAIFWCCTGNWLKA